MAHDHASSTSTAPDPDLSHGASGLRRARQARAARRVGLTLVVALVLVGLTGQLGSRTSEGSATAPDGTELTVTYPSRSRPGLAVDWEVSVRRPGGFDGPITLRTRAAYLAIFDENGLDPDPAAASQDGATLTWTFDPPPGEELVVSFDARTEPAVESGADGWTSLVGPDGRELVRVTYRTEVMP